MTPGEINGLLRFQDCLKLLPEELRDDFGEAFYQEALLIEEDSRERTPVQTGSLRDSHFTHHPLKDGKGLVVAISVGSSERATVRDPSPYAITVHETLGVYHPHGEAKFLHNAMMKASDGFIARVVGRVDFQSDVDKASH